MDRCSGLPRLSHGVMRCTGFAFGLTVAKLPDAIGLTRLLGRANARLRRRLSTTPVGFPGSRIPCRRLVAGELDDGDQIVGPHGKVDCLHLAAQVANSFLAASKRAGEFLTLRMPCWVALIGLI